MSLVALHLCEHQFSAREYRDSTSITVNRVIKQLGLEGVPYNNCIILHVEKKRIEPHVELCAHLGLSHHVFLVYHTP